jgi:hypothetical protein
MSHPERSQALGSLEAKWCVIAEQEIESIGYQGLAAVAKEHGGLMITGFAGTGKTWPVFQLLPALAEMFPGKKIIKMALRHAAAMLLGGHTIAHYLCKYRSKGIQPGTIVVLDEMSEVSLHTWVELARWKLVGVLFICIGDMRGQRKPMFDRWGDAMSKKDILHSQFLFELCGGVRVEMTTNRRGDDPVLFKRYCELYPYADDPTHLNQAAQQGLKQYPWTPGIQCYFCMPHEKRVILNRAMNYAFAEHKDVLYLPESTDTFGVTMRPQAMLLWRGLVLLFCCRKYEINSPVSGVVYTALDFTDKTVTVCLHKDYVQGEPPEYVLTHKKAASVLRPQFAICIAAIQGRTFRDVHVGLLDLENPHMTMRDVITAMSRPTNGKYLHFVSTEEQARLLCEARKITDEDLAQRAGL